MLDGSDEKEFLLLPDCGVVDDGQELARVEQLLVGRVSHGRHKLGSGLTIWKNLVRPLDNLYSL